MKKIILLIVLIAACGIIFSCKKNDSSVKGGYANVVINLNDPTALQLNAIGGWIYFTGVDAGLKGLIVYRRSQDEYVAYDRACTYDPTGNCSLIIESSGIIAADTCCGSKFEIYSGSVTHDPATQPLIQYQVSHEGNNLYITNF